MNIHLDTNNREAFELAVQALGDINLYKQSKEASRLDVASIKLQLALDIDPNFLRARYYHGIVKDLSGKAVDAIEDFETVLRENPPFLEEVRYNLAVAHYHRYNWTDLEEAIRHFESVIGATSNKPLKLLARAGLAQAYAMRMIPQQPDNADIDSIKSYFAKTKKQYDYLLWDINIPIIGFIVGRLKIRDEVVLSEVRWSAYNARGMSLMYYSDYIPNHRENNLNEALRELNEADKYSPKNWANYCDIASAHMRLGYWKQSDQHFELALKKLEEVVLLLRPGYGFALYEEGRVYRLMSNKLKALEYFDKALAVPYKYRDVSDRRVNLEKDRAERGDKSYP